MLPAPWLLQKIARLLQTLEGSHSRGMLPESKGAGTSNLAEVVLPCLVEIPLCMSGALPDPSLGLAVGHHTGSL
jgi:hypothetical protein